MNSTITTALNRSILLDKAIYFELNAELPSHVIPKEHEELDVFKNFAYPVSSWPIIINQTMSNELADLSVKIPKLISKIPLLYFENNIKEIADFYFGGDELAAHFSLLAHDKKVETSCRLDLIYSEKGFEIIEVNIGSSIGGYQLQCFEPVIRKEHDELKKKEQYKFFDSLTIYMRFLVDKIVEKFSKDQKEFNIYMGINADASVKEEVKNAQTDFFNSFYQTELHKRGLKGRAFGGAISDLRMSGKHLGFNNQCIHAVINVEPNGRQMPRSLVRAFMMDKIYFPDHLAVNIYEDKRNLGLLRELAEQNKFEPFENELILNCIPVTFEVKDEKVFYEGQENNLIDLLKNNKDDFVIKPANGFQGIDVFIGKKCNSNEWGKVIELALKDKIFIAQKYSESLNFYAPNSVSQWTPHKLVWGAFGFGKEYGGVIVRMKEEGVGDGVINSANGAILGVVYETHD